MTRPAAHPRKCRHRSLGCGAGRRVVDRLARVRCRASMTSHTRRLCSIAKAGCLRPYATAQGRWRLPATIDGVDPRFVALLLAYEDRRFRSHPGVDPLALGRAAYQWVRRGHIVSGGSTLSMQVARLLEPRTERSLSAKLRQMVRAIELDYRLGKDEVLALYLSLAPYGGNLEGIRAASLAYFGKEPRRLSLAESALLVALPQSPEAAPARSLDRRRARRARPRARPHCIRRHRAGRRDRAREARTGAGRPQADADARARTPPIRQSPPHPAAEFTVSPSTRRCRKNLEDLARERARAHRTRYFGRHRRGGQCDRRSVRARRLGRLFRRASRRPGRHDTGAPLARFRA